MKRVHLGIGIAILVLTGAGAIVYASVPHAFTTGDTLQAADLNGNFTALDQRITALEAAQMHWDGYLNRGQGLNTTTPSNTIAHVTFTPPVTGNIVVRAHFSTAIRNNFDNATSGDCNVVSQLSTGMTAPPTNPASGALGISQIFVAANLPTQAGGGSYQWFPQTAEGTFAATAGTALTVYLNGVQSGAGCQGVVYFSLDFSADFSTKSATMTVATP
jgi:hypothetical protein